MRPESKVVSLSTAKLLRDAGFNVETERWWVHDANGPREQDWYLAGEAFKAGVGMDFDGKEKACYWGINDGSLIEIVEKIRAPDAAELGEALPMKKIYTKLWLVDSKWAVFDTFTASEVDQSKEILSGFENEVEARAAAYLWLRKQGLV